MGLISRVSSRTYRNSTVHIPPKNPPLWLTSTKITTAITKPTTNQSKRQEEPVQSCSATILRSRLIKNKKVTLTTRKLLLNWKKKTRDQTPTEVGKAKFKNQAARKKSKTKVLQALNENKSCLRQTTFSETLRMETEPPRIQKVTDIERSTHQEEKAQVHFGKKNLKFKSSENKQRSYSFENKFETFKLPLLPQWHVFNKTHNNKKFFPFSSNFWFGLKYFRSFIVRFIPDMLVKNLLVRKSK